MSRRKSFSLCLAGLACLALPCFAQLRIAERGKAPEYTIVHAADAAPSVVLGVKEFQSYVERQTGVKLPVSTDAAPLPPKAILVGTNKYAKTILGNDYNPERLKDDGFMLRTCDNYLVVLGGKRGAMYGLYEILERFGGCRWYASWHEVVPEKDEFVVPTLNEVQIPAFLMREPFWYDMFNTRQAYLNKCNGNAMKLNENQGGKIRFGGGMFVHTFNVLVPPSEFYATHPEYFAEINGKRLSGYVQLCLTNKDVLKIVTERIMNAIRKDPNAAMYSVSQNDAYNYCLCKECTAMAEKFGGQTGLLIWFINQVAEKVETEFPNALIETLAYQYTRTPPTGIKPRHNVLPRLCTIECDFSLPLDVSPALQNKKFVNDIKGWSSMTDKLFIWDYTTNFAHYLTPFPNFGALQGNVKFFRDNHVIGLMEQGAYQGYHAEFAELRGWLLAKLLWNPDQDIKPLLDDFFKGYYGPAAKYVREYFDELQSLVSAPSVNLKIFDTATPSWMSDDFLARATKLWENAEAAVKDNPAFLYNVRKGSLPVYYSRYIKHPKEEPILAWSDNEVTLVNGNSPFARICQECHARLTMPDPSGNVRYIRLAEGSRDELRKKWLAFSGNYPVSVIAGGGFELGVCENLGGTAGWLKDESGFNYINGNGGGLGFTTNFKELFATNVMLNNKTASDASSVTMTMKQGKLNGTRKLSLSNTGVTMTNTLKNNDNAAQTASLIPYAAFALGDCSSICWRLDGGKWNLFTVNEQMLNETFAIGPSMLTGARMLEIASPATGKGMAVTLPEHQLDRVLLNAYANEGTVKVAIQQSKDTVANGAEAVCTVTMKPLAKLTGLPTAPQRKQAAKIKIVIEDNSLPLGKIGTWGEYVLDDGAKDGAAIKLFNTHFEWCIQYRPDMSLFKPDKKYQIRIRAKVEKEKGKTSGEAFWCGAYDTAKAIHRGQIDPDISQIKDGYQWYDVIVWTPNQDDYIWAGPGRFGKNGSAIHAVFIDQIEFMELD